MSNTRKIVLLVIAGVCLVIAIVIFAGVFNSTLATGLAWFAGGVLALVVSQLPDLP